LVGLGRAEAAWGIDKIQSRGGSIPCTCFHFSTVSRCPLQPRRQVSRLSRLQQRCMPSFGNVFLFPVSSLSYLPIFLLAAETRSQAMNALFYSCALVHLLFFPNASSPPPPPNPPTPSSPCCEP
ncbi:unnamed protein product, partial [Discosporangium mesarthrocarpum]